jgi:peptidoglycan/LPS O-acetylase OafA/YrhL
MQKHNYRSDIDGLRGLAVLSVILFHYKVFGITGGFIGVDIFFVISGFLITSNILTDIENNTWSYANFYTRRMLRLFPALFVTLTASFIIAVIALPPHDLTWFASTLIHSAVSTSNFLYWFELRYFGPAAERTPLLHTWSLSVEEQFYLIWPALMLIFFNKRYNLTHYWFIGFLLCVSIISIGIGQYLLETNTNAVFYLMPFRLAEFALGALVIWLPIINTKYRILEEILLTIGLSLIVFSIVTYTNKIPFPGINILPPMVGSVLVIYAGRAKLIGKILNNSIMIWLGLISYSLYLIHWPILIFTELMLLRSITPIETIIMLFANLFIAHVMLHYVEQPFRITQHHSYSWRLKPAHFGIASAGLIIFLMWIGSTILIGKGWSWRVPKEIRVALAGVDAAHAAREAHIRTGSCHMNMWQNATAQGDYVDKNCLQIDSKRANYLLLGDSHGADRYVGLSTIFVNVNFLQMTTASCRPLLDNKFRSYHCKERLEYAFRNFLLHNIVDGVILAGRWQRTDIAALEKTLIYLRSLKTRVIVLGPAAEFKPWIVDLIFHYGKRQGLEQWVSQFLVPERLQIDRQLSDLSKKIGVEYYSSINSLCPKHICSILNNHGRLLIIDEGHQSPEGAIIQAQGFKNLGLDFPP